jgi:hypothetical protein
MFYLYMYLAHMDLTHSATSRLKRSQRRKTHSRHIYRGYFATLENTIFTSLDDIELHLTQQTTHFLFMLCLQTSLN